MLEVRVVAAVGTDTDRNGPAKSMFLLTFQIFLLTNQFEIVLGAGNSTSGPGGGAFLKFIESKLKEKELGKNGLRSIFFEMK